MRATVFLSACLCLLLLGGCESSSRLAGLPPPSEDPAAAMAAVDPGPDLAERADPTMTGSLPPGARPPGAGAASESTRDEELARGKKAFAAGHYAAAERHFRHAAERQPDNAEAWLGLAAAYDQERRFAAADHAYDKAVELIGPTPEILNNRGYSYLLRGDFARARQILLEARAKDPSSPYIKNNLDLLESKVRTAKAAAH